MSNILKSYGFSNTLKRLSNILKRHGSGMFTAEVFFFLADLWQFRNLLTCQIHVRLEDVQVVLRLLGVLVCVRREI